MLHLILNMHLKFYTDATCKITILSCLPVGGCYAAVQPPSVFNTSSIIKLGGATSPISSQKTIQYLETFQEVYLMRYSCLLIPRD